MRLEKCCRKLPELSTYDLYDASYGHYGEGSTKTTTIITTPVVVARGGREISNPAKTTTALRDGS